MKTTVLAVLLTVQSLCAQEHHLWIGLSGNRVMLDVVLRSVQEESVTVESNGRMMNVWLNEIEQARVIRGGLDHAGGGCGGGTGLVIGGLVGFLGAPREDRNWRAGTTALAVGMIGGIIGSVLESMPEEDEILGLREKTIAAKREIFEEILRQPSE